MNVMWERIFHAPSSGHAPVAGGGLRYAGGGWLALRRRGWLVLRRRCLTGSRAKGSGDLRDRRGGGIGRTCRAGLFCNRKTRWQSGPRDATLV